MNTESNINDAVLANAAAGDDSARGKLYKQYSKAMFNICIRMTGDRTNAQDMLQESFITAFKNIHQAKSMESFGGWLRTIVVNTCIKQCKKQRTWQEIDERFEIADEVSESWIEEIDLSEVHQEIKNLPNGCREVFNLYVVEDYTHREIADALGISESTSKSQYQRARLLLKERLLKQMMPYG